MKIFDGKINATLLIYIQPQQNQCQRACIYQILTYSFNRS
ncbi:hypothetical protein [Rhodobacteraceae phage LS06-2018-MD06]|nr:hypothetical protein [Rhodobacteraceae phage LS06-2018-MD06]